MTEAAVFYDRGVAREAAGPEALLERYEALLTEAVAGADDEFLAESGVDDGTLQSIRTGEAGAVSVEDAAAAIAAADGADPDALLAEVRDGLLLGMSSAMLDVDRVAADVEGDVDPKEIQGMVEGRHPMTVEEYARIHHYVASKGG